jgi:hypothetical protein
MDFIQRVTCQLADVSHLFGLAFYPREAIATECSINGFDPTRKNRLGKSPLEESADTATSAPTQTSMASTA